MPDIYRGNKNIKAAGVPIEWTQEKLDEYKKCANDPVYFLETYMKVIHVDHGLTPFKLYDYQRNLIEHMNDNRFSVVLAARQSGKSITAVGYILWYAMFHSEKTIAVLANKGSTSKEMLSRIVTALENIPFFLQPGSKVVNKGNIEFENNSEIIAASTSANSIRGLSISLLYLDEFAFVENADTFYTSTYPVVTSGKTSKVIITSTANGIGNPFHRIWEGAVQGTNEFKPFRIDWWDVPGRDEEWKRQTIRNTSETQFAQEFANDFLGTGNTLINSNALLSLKAREAIWQKEGAVIYEEPQENHQYIITVDVAKGRGQDSSAFSVIDISVTPYKQVAAYNNSLISPLLYPTVIERFAKMFNNAYVIIESNDQGSVVCNGLYYDIEYENVYVSSMHKSDGIGINMDKKVKRIGCSNLKDLIEEKRFEVYDKTTIQELTTFVAKGQSFEADGNNHDDMVMTLVLFAYFSTTSFFAELTDDNVKSMLFDEKMKQIEDNLTPFGIIDDGNTPEEYIEDDGTRWVVDQENRYWEERMDDDIFGGWNVMDKYKGF